MALHHVLCIEITPWMTLSAFCPIEGRLQSTLSCFIRSKGSLGDIYRVLLSTERAPREFFRLEGPLSSDVSITDSVPAKSSIAVCLCFVHVVFPYDCQGFALHENLSYLISAPDLKATSVCHIQMTQ